jgi:DNA-binding NarL/FixJ family response regulator
MRSVDKPATFVIAEDFGPWRATLRNLLNRPDWRMVGEACDGPSAVKKATRLQPNIVILDIGLPGLNGIDAAKLIRQSCPTTKVIFLTQQTDDEVKQAAIEAGCAGYVVKARARKDLTPAITAALQAASAEVSS